MWAMIAIIMFTFKARITFHDSQHWAHWKHVHQVIFVVEAVVDCADDHLSASYWCLLLPPLFNKSFCWLHQISQYMQTWTHIYTQNKFYIKRDLACHDNPIFFSCVRKCCSLFIHGGILCFTAMLLQKKNDNHSFVKINSFAHLYSTFSHKLPTHNNYCLEGIMKLLFCLRC